MFAELSNKNHKKVNLTEKYLNLAKKKQKKTAEINRKQLKEACKVKFSRSLN